MNVQRFKIFCVSLGCEIHARNVAEEAPDGALIPLDVQEADPVVVDGDSDDDGDSLDRDDDQNEDLDEAGLAYEASLPDDERVDDF